MSKIDPTTLIGRTWGSLSAEERASLPVGTRLGAVGDLFPVATLRESSSIPGTAWWFHGAWIRGYQLHEDRTVASVPS